MIILFSFQNSSQDTIDRPSVKLVVLNPVLQGGQVSFLPDQPIVKLSVLTATLTGQQTVLTVDTPAIKIGLINFDVQGTLNTPVIRFIALSPVLEGGELALQPDRAILKLNVSSITLLGQQTTLPVDSPVIKIGQISFTIDSPVTVTLTGPTLKIVSIDPVITAGTLTLTADIATLAIVPATFTLSTPVTIIPDKAYQVFKVQSVTLNATANLTPTAPRIRILGTEPNLDGGFGQLTVEGLLLKLIVSDPQLSIQIFEPPIIPGSWLVNLNASLFIALSEYLISQEYAINDMTKPKNINLLLAFPDDLTKISDRTIAIENVPTVVNMSPNQIGTSGWDYEMNVQYDVYAKTDRDIDTLLYRISEHLREPVTYYDWETVLSGGYVRGDTGLLIDFDNLSTGRVRKKEELLSNELLRHVGFVRVRTSIASDNLL